MGDPAGVGPEVTLKAIAEMPGSFVPIIVGDIPLLRDAAKRSGLSSEFTAWNPSEDLPAGVVAVFPIDAPSSPPAFGQVRKEYGAFAWKAIVAAVDLVQNHHADALVTAPLCKQSLQMAGCPHPGHTELLAELADIKRPIMMLANPRMKVVLVTTHLPLKYVPETITRDRVIETLEITDNSFIRFGWGSPRMGVLGLNPQVPDIAACLARGIEIGDRPEVGHRGAVGIRAPVDIIACDAGLAVVGDP